MSAMASGPSSLHKNFPPIQCRPLHLGPAARSPAQITADHHGPIKRRVARSTARSAAWSSGPLYQRHRRHPAVIMSFPLGPPVGATYRRCNRCHSISAASGDDSNADEPAPESAAEQSDTAGTPQGSPAAGSAADQGDDSASSGGFGGSGAAPPLSRAEEAAQVWIDDCRV